MNDRHIRSRSEYRAKRRKTNVILNTLIAIVVLLIFIIGWNIFFSEPSSAPSNQKTSEQQNEETSSNNLKGDKGENDTVKAADREKEEETAVNEEETNGDMIENESDEPNVEKVITHSGWQPIGTEQLNGHESSYSKNTVDWNEKLAAAAYAIETTVDNMTTWWVTGGEDPENQAILTVSEKGSPHTYRVHIEWIDGEGWKPVEMKKLIENDRKQ